MSNDSKQHGSGRSRAGVCVLVVIAAAGGVYAGARWHSAIDPILGLGAQASSTPDHENARAAADAPHVVWTCSMHPQVRRDKPGLCPICHMQLTPLNVESGGGAMSHVHTQDKAHGAGSDEAATTMPGETQASKPTKERKVKFWWDPMLNPPYISDRPGKSPMGMDLVPVYENEPGDTSRDVVIDPAIVQNMGVRVAMVKEGPLARIVRAVGYLDEAQPNVREINLRVSGWIKRLHANTEGQHIEAGDPLFDLYSPELRLAIEELINARRAKASLSANADAFSKETATSLYSAALDKLELLGLARPQIEALAKLDKAPPTVTFVSPVAGHLTEKPVTEGAAVKAGDRVLRIVDHSMLWLDARVFEKDLPYIKVGQAVSAVIASRSGEPLTAKVIFIHPHVDMMTRTALVRVAIPNPTLTLKPGMYATVYARSQVVDKTILVPREAVIDTGDSQIAFVARAVGRFEPRKVRMGLAGEDGMVQVVEGLSAGESVVTSGQFLLDSESRLREAIQKYLNDRPPATTQPVPQSEHDSMSMPSRSAPHGDKP